MGSLPASVTDIPSVTRVRPCLSKTRDPFGNEALGANSLFHPGSIAEWENESNTLPLGRKERGSNPQVPVLEGTSAFQADAVAICRLVLPSSLEQHWWRRKESN